MKSLIHNLLRLLLAMPALLLLAGCDTTEADGPSPQGVIVANQGNFGDANGSISVFDPVSGALDAGAVTSIGTIIQSVLLHEQSLFVMSNTGGRIDVFDAESFERTAQIPEVVSPRYMVADGHTGYVSSLYGAEGTFSGGLVTVVDLDGHTKVAEIPVGDNPEGLALVGTRLYVANHGFGAGTSVSVIDVAAWEVIETIDVQCDGPRFVETDLHGDVFVFCTGRTVYDEDFNPIGETDGAVRVLDGETGAILKHISVDGRIGTAGPGQDAFLAPTVQVAFVVKDERSLLVFDTESHDLEEEIGPFSGPALSAVAYDDQSGRLYLGRSRGFTQAGEVSIHDRSGTELDRFTAGVAPAFIAFSSSE